jgi:hypothetical protein
MIRTLIALCFVLIAGSAQAATCYWVGGSGVWSNPVRWANVSGGASGVGSTCGGSGGIPGSVDVAIIDNHANGLAGGTLTLDMNVTLGTASTAFSAGLANGTIDFAGFNVTAGAFALSNTGTRKFIGGSGTFTATTGSWDLTTTTGLDPTSSFASATIIFAANPTTNRSFNAGNLAYGTVQIANTGTTARVTFTINGTPTITTFIPSAVPWISLASNVTITNGFSLAGTSTEQVLLTSNDANGASRTLTVGGAVTMSWVAIAGITRAGAGTIVATNSFNLGNNNTDASFSISPPSGGASGGKIIGGGI